MNYPALIVLLGFSLVCAAQSTASVSVNASLPTVTLLDIEPTTSAISLTLQTPVEAGFPVTVPADNATKWLNFTSAVAVGGSRKITAQVTSGTIPNGLRLKLSLSNYTGSGAGTLGSPVSSAYLSTSAQNIVTGIGGAYTGNGSNNGYNLTYGLEINSYSQLRHNASTTLTITYTILDN